MKYTDRIETILKKNRKKREKDPYNVECDHVLFLDYDGVINTDPSNYGTRPFNSNCMTNLNNLCNDYDLKIVVTSSWKKYSFYQDMLKDSGLDEDIVILGKTEFMPNGSREDGIKQYLIDHIYIDYFIILEDASFNELKKYQIQTSYYHGFDDDKYEEAKRLLNRLKSMSVPSES